jgi:phage-related protein
MSALPERDCVFIASTRDDLSAMPEEVKRLFGFAIRAAQRGSKHPDAKPLKGFGGAGVLEIVEDFDRSTYRAVYTVKFDEAIYVLHAFQKKSRSGIKTPRHEIDLIRERLKEAERQHQARQQR